MGSDERPGNRLEFETLISDLSSRFINLPPGEVDRGIEDALRRRKLVSWLPWTAETPVPRAPGRLEDDVCRRESVRDALGKLPGKYRTILLLHDYQGFKCCEIGEMLNISLDAAKKRLARGREMFRDVYDRSERGSVT